MLKEVAGLECKNLHGILSDSGFIQKSTRLDGVDYPCLAWHISDYVLAMKLGIWEEPGVVEPIGNLVNTPENGHYNDYVPLTCRTSSDHLLLENDAILSGFSWSEKWQAGQNCSR